ncbi:hypothetical protein [Candidatus Cyanaurora vandensis]|uniref:hypothetical protein n=1 Tax=Candidatus Cyanaurora vandensis TaxID=2714958 RepID=UPI00257D63B1|nr:hypothetical protein [Candidatus Cyanaurora vandensis]
MTKPVDTALAQLIDEYGFMPILNSLRRLCEQEARVKRDLFFVEFWTYASQNLAAAELLLLKHVQQGGKIDTD